MREAIKRAVVWLLTQAARFALWRHRPTLIAVVGPVGKTTIKDAIFASLAPLGHTRKSKASHNTELTVPLTIVGVDVPAAPVGWVWAVAQAWWHALVDRRFPRWLVLEIGTDRPGDMAQFTRWLHPQVVVGAWFPAIPPHVEFFASPEALYAEDWRILEALAPGGAVVVNADDERSLPFVRNTTRERHTIITYGFGEEADVRLRRYGLLTTRRHGVVVPRGVRGVIRATLSHEHVNIHRFGVVGATHLYPWAAAAAVRLALGLPLGGLSEAARAAKPTPGRLRLFEGKGGMVLIDDTYNASPDAAVAALEALRELPQEHKVAVLGDMLELGAHTPAAHEEVGRLVAKVASCVIAVGLRARRLAAAAREAGAHEVHEFATPEEAAHFLLERVAWHAPTTAVLLKASRGIRMERAVRLLLAHPQRDAAFTVDPEAPSHA